MDDTQFHSVHGLPPSKGQKPDETTAQDLSILSRELVKRTDIFEYTGTKERLRVDEARGNIVQAHVVLNEGHEGDDAMAKALQDHVKATIAPYKYPRSIVFTDSLPKTATGKIQRFQLREVAR